MSPDGRGHCQRMQAQARGEPKALSGVIAPGKEGVRESKCEMGVVFLQ